MSVPRQQVAAGMVVVRRGPGGTRVLVLHHREYDEWRLPKGKLDVGETAAAAAERELAEETGLDLPAGRLLGTTSHQMPARAERPPTRKIVFFFAGGASEQDEVTLEPTFDGFEWLSPPEAIERLTWPNEQSMVRRALQA